MLSLKIPDGHYVSGVANQAPWLATDLWALLGIAKQVLPSRLADAGHAQTLHNNRVIHACGCSKLYLPLSPKRTC